MKVGDLIQVPPCERPLDCICFFCNGYSNRIGLVIEDMLGACGTWNVLFDCGEWEIHWTDLEKEAGENGFGTKVISRGQK